MSMSLIIMEWERNCVYGITDNDLNSWAFAFLFCHIEDERQGKDRKEGPEEKLGNSRTCDLDNSSKAKKACD